MERRQSLDAGPAADRWQVLMVPARKTGKRIHFAWTWRVSRADATAVRSYATFTTADECIEHARLNGLREGEPIEIVLGGV